MGTVGASYDGGDAGPTSAAPTASKTAPAQSSLAARSAQTSVSDNFLRNYVAPTADFSQAVQMTPGLFSYSPNGVGLGDTRTNFRGFTDGNYNMTFDGIPFQDTNGVSHHSWVFFPGPFLGGTVVDRSPGSASTIGVATFNGSINLLSRNLDPQESSTVSGSLGSWNTHTLGFEHETGQFGEDGNQNLLFTAQNMTSDGYQTYNDQSRKDFSLKYQNALTNNTVLTVFASALNMQNNTPNVVNPTRGQIAQYGNNYLLSNDPTKANYWRYNFYNVDTYFDYVGITSNLGDGWKLDDKVYAYRYGNNQNYANVAPTAANIATSASAKLNEYETKGNILRLSKESSMGTLRTGLWLDYADSVRYTTNANPQTWVNSGLPQNQETYTTTTVQPFVEYEFNVTDKLKVTPGLKYAFYQQDFNHMPDTGSPGVGNLGGAASVSNTVSYHDVLPSFDVHYMLQPNWSLYGQYGTGDIIPPTSVFDVKNAYVATQPKPQYARTTQFGTVWQSDKYTFDFDVYHTSLQGSYSSYLDANLNPVYYLSGTEISQGIEAESNILLGSGFSLYLNGTYGSVKYANTGLWFAGAPSDTETVGLS
ncbi:MAG TPA: TonB-dependent receptor, partial [Herbaspirillum sp.]|nr:TonB-dependent receptor [Herbaspirillum sp.]